jgi:hypothetical protein
MDLELLGDQVGQWDTTGVAHLGVQGPRSRSLTDRRSPAHSPAAGLGLLGHRTPQNSCWTSEVERCWRWAGGDQGCISWSSEPADPEDGAPVSVEVSVVVLAGADVLAAGRSADLSRAVDHPVRRAAVPAHRDSTLDLGRGRDGDRDRPARRAIEPTGRRPLSVRQPLLRRSREVLRRAARGEHVVTRYAQRLRDAEGALMLAGVSNGVAGQLEKIGRSRSVAATSSTPPQRSRGRTVRQWPPHSESSPRRPTQPQTTDTMMSNDPDHKSTGLVRPSRRTVVKRQRASMQELASTETPNAEGDLEEGEN